jgi:hypothetical protein
MQEMLDDILINMFHYLLPNDLVTLCFVSKKFNSIASDDTQWKKYILDEKLTLFPPPVKICFNNKTLMPYLTDNLISTYKQGKLFIECRNKLLENIKDKKITAKFDIIPFKTGMINFFKDNIFRLTYMQVILYSDNSKLQKTIGNDLLNQFISIDAGCIEMILSHPDIFNTQSNLYKGIDDSLLIKMIEKDPGKDNAVTKLILKNDNLHKHIDEFVINKMIEKVPSSIDLIKNHSNPEISKLAPKTGYQLFH